MALTSSYVGNNAVGASSQVPNANSVYVTRVTVPADSVLSAVEGYLQLTNASTMAFRVGVWADNAGAPGVCIAMATQPSVDSVTTGGTDRWFGAPVHLWFDDEADVWLGVHLFDPSGVTLAYESSGGSDRTITAGSTWTAEAGAVGTTVSASTANRWSIRGLVVA